jgi:hypothetical protein
MGHALVLFDPDAVLKGPGRLPASAHRTAAHRGPAAGARRGGHPAHPARRGLRDADQGPVADASRTGWTNAVRSARALSPLAGVGLAHPALCCASKERVHEADVSGSERRAVVASVDSLLVQATALSINGAAPRPVGGGIGPCLSPARRIATAAPPRRRLRRDRRDRIGSWRWRGSSRPSCRRRSRVRCRTGSRRCTRTRSACPHPGGAEQAAGEVGVDVRRVEDASLRLSASVTFVTCWAVFSSRWAYRTWLSRP